MASEFTDPPSGEIGNYINNSNSANRQSPPGPYVDQALTLVAVDSSPAPALNVPPPSGSTTLGGIRPVYANDQKEDIENTDAASDNAGVTPPPHVNEWTITTDGQGISRSRDPYRNNGVATYLNNAS